MSKRKVVNWRRYREIAKKALDMLGISGYPLDAKLSSFNVADKQIIAICRALVHDAKLIIMDEPTSALNQREVKDLFKIINKLKDRGISTLFVSHKLNEVFEISERFTILRNGEKVITGNTSDYDAREFVYYMTGRKISEKAYDYKDTGEKPILEVKNLGLKNNFSNVNFSLQKGEILGITGLMGSGRTELALSLFGIEHVDTGDIIINDKKRVIRSVKDAKNSNIGYVPEDRLTEGLFLPQSIGINIAISKIDQLVNRIGFIKKQELVEEIDKGIEELAIVTPNVDNAVRTLSGGNQQRVVLARWLLLNLDILILNSPTVGVDIASKFDIHEILRNLAENGMGIILISDDISDLVSCCNRLLIMKKGEIVGEVTEKEKFEEGIIEATKAIAN